MSIVEAHEKAKSHADNLARGQTVFQSRQHAPKQPSFNRRSSDLIVDPVPPAPPITAYFFSSVTHPALVAKIADLLAVRGDITPQQRYNVAMQHDIG
jgi:hypothetical protein